MSSASLVVSPGSPPARWEVRVPGSKSITNRALLLAGVADGTLGACSNPLIADDTEVMAAALRALGASVELEEADPDDDGRLRWSVGGLGGATDGNARRCTAGRPGRSDGSWFRCSPPARGRFSVDAHPQLRRRPLGPVLAALRAQGATIDGEAFPLVIDASGAVRRRS